MTTAVFARILQLQLPYDRGLDVLALQRGLVQLGFRTGTGEHCDRFVQWFNDCIQLFANLPQPPQVSFVRLLGGQSVQRVAA